MPTEDNKILKYNHGEKSLKAPFIITFDLSERKAKHDPSGWAMFIKCSFDKEKNRFDYYRGIDCIEKWCEKLKDRVTEIINYKEKEMIPLTDEEIKFYEKQKECHVCKKEFCYD